VSESRAIAKNTIKSVNGTELQLHCRSVPPRRIGTCIDHRPKQAAFRLRYTAA
jgi:hypothetical protein